MSTPRRRPARARPARGSATRCGARARARCCWRKRCGSSRTRRCRRSSCSTPRTASGSASRRRALLPLGFGALTAVGMLLGRTRPARACAPAAAGRCRDARRRPARRRACRRHRERPCPPSRWLLSAPGSSPRSASPTSRASCPTARPAATAASSSRAERWPPRPRSRWPGSPRRATGGYDAVLWLGAAALAALVAARTRRAAPADAPRPGAGAARQRGGRRPGLHVGARCGGGSCGAPARRRAGVRRRRRAACDRRHARRAGGGRARARAAARRTTAARAVR